MQKRNKKKGSGIKKKNIFLAAMLLVFAILIVGVTFFRIADIEIDGNDVFSDEEIRSFVMKEPYSYSTILMKLFRQRADISSEPMLSSVKIDVTSRNSISVFVVERKVIGYVDFADSYVYFDSNGIAVRTENMADSNNEEPEVMEALESGMISPKESITEFIPHVEGLCVKSMVIDQPIEVEDKKIFSVLATLNKSVLHDNIIPDRVIVTEKGQLELYFDKLHVLLGSNDNIVEKISTLANMYDELIERYDSGVLDMDKYDGEFQTNMTMKILEDDSSKSEDEDSENYYDQ